MQEIIQTLQEEFYEALKETAACTPRAYKFPEAKSLIKVAVGMRRAGKTLFLYQSIRELVSAGIPLSQILYINFEDKRLAPMEAKDMGKLIDAWYTLYPDNHHRLCYIFLDEVQNVEGWPMVLRRISDTKKAQIYISGSSAKLLSSEIATSLRGRSIASEIQPYNYSEYLAARGYSLPSKPYGRIQQDYQRKYLLEFLRIGGFPGIQSLSPTEQLETLQNYVETVILRDIVERHEISNIVLLKYFIGFLIKNTSSLFSINKFYKDIKSQGYKVGKDTLHLYLSYIEDAFLIFTVPIFSESLRHIHTTPRKIYSIDNGLTHANSFNFQSNIGKSFENQVYLDLRRQGKKVFYYKTSDGYEIDFITQDIHGNFEIIQVCWDTDDAETLEREQRALEQAKQQLGFPGKIIDFHSYMSFFVTIT